MESKPTFFAADKVSILSNVGSKGALITEMLSDFGASVAPMRREIVTKTSGKHTQLLTLEIIVTGR